MSSHPSPARWTKLGKQVVAQTRIFDLCSIRYRHPTRESERDFVVIDSPDWVNVIALTVDRRLVLVNQFRYGIDGFSLEIPGGIVDAGENPIEAGIRELREETGNLGRSVRLLGSIRPNPAIQNNFCHIVLVEQCAPAAELEWDEDEEIEVVEVPVDDVYRWAESGRIQHSLVLSALLLFKPVWEQLKMIQNPPIR